jgi:hypothetical protein
MPNLLLDVNAILHRLNAITGSQHSKCLDLSGPPFKSKSHDLTKFYDFIKWKGGM